jgi:alkylation response protein AidB-like acyl-CoA dehydrogenase
LTPGHSQLDLRDATWTCVTARGRRLQGQRSAPGSAENRVGEFAARATSAGPGREHEGFEIRLAWEQVLGKAGWTCLGWPTEWGGRGASIAQQVIWNEEYVRASCPARVGVFGEGLLGPTLIAYGTEEQKSASSSRSGLGPRALVPGLLRARRRVGPRQRPDVGESSTGTNG